ncbi:hypothetical protein [Brevibacterium oceani]|uniref:hypothetical protein n=1 Tax=Brevibacterium oceani TaxID=358099 RepID=UPI0015E72B3C|nr:hypothetical protein [Brevibacterium oceani]
MSFIKITTMYSEDYEITSITEQNVVSAKDAFGNRVERLRARSSRHEADAKKLTILIYPTDVVDYSQLLQYADTLAGFGDYQPGLFEVTP